MLNTFIYAKQIYYPRIVDHVIMEALDSIAIAKEALEILSFIIVGHYYSREQMTKMMYIMSRKMSALSKESPSKGFIRYIHQIDIRD